MGLFDLTVTVYPHTSLTSRWDHGQGPAAPCAVPLEVAVIELSFVAGTVEARGLGEDGHELGDLWQWDPRSRCHRAAALAYPSTIVALHRAGISYRDDARRYQRLDLQLCDDRELRPYQQEALDKWIGASSRGVVVLPTGAGKTMVAIRAIHLRQRSALVVAPTLDLVRQWYDALHNAFGCAVGVIGGGEHRLESLTVTTYESAWIHMPNYGNRFGTVVFDECHHLPSHAHTLAAEQCLAPFRLGLTATPERPDGRDADLQWLIGPTVLRRDIVELAGRWLAQYDVQRIVVALTEQERLEHDEARAIYRDFLRRNAIIVGKKGGWSTFIMRAAGSDDGQRAMDAWRRSKELAFAASAKLDTVDDLLCAHSEDRALIFTEKNATAYAISRRFLVPVITHHTKVSERSEILAGLRAGRYGAVVTSKVLNEGVDVPEANIAIVVSGSGSVREHVQRLGRVLRPRQGKRATLYELVSEGTTEQYTSSRRRDHSAYR